MLIKLISYNFSVKKTVPTLLNTDKVKYIYVLEDTEMDANDVLAKNAGAKTAVYLDDGCLRAVNTLDEIYEMSKGNVVCL